MIPPFVQQQWDADWWLGFYLMPAAIVAVIIGGLIARYKQETEDEEQKSDLVALMLEKEDVKEQNLPLR